jgi:hypothetical protein
MASTLDTSPMDAKSRELFDDTNRRRVANGLPPLRESGLLVGIARLRSRDMADPTSLRRALNPAPSSSAWMSTPLPSLISLAPL